MVCDRGNDLYRGDELRLHIVRSFDDLIVEMIWS